MSTERWGDEFDRTGTDVWAFLISNLESEEDTMQALSYWTALDLKVEGTLTEDPMGKRQARDADPDSPAEGVRRGARTTLDAIAAGQAGEADPQNFTSFFQLANVGATPLRQERFGMGTSSSLVFTDRWQDDEGQVLRSVRVWICVQGGVGVDEEVKECLKQGEFHRGREETPHRQS